MALTDINIYTLKQVRAKRRRYDLEGCRITCALACYATLEVILDLKSEPVEKFGIIALNAKNEINGIHIICTVSLNHNIIEPREVFMAAMMNNAKSIIAFHNHPSGDPSPSQDDIHLTQRLKEAGQILGIALLDHMITGNGKFTSLKEEKLF
jgi:DNA repair protein RadC